MRTSQSRLILSIILLLTVSLSSLSLVRAQTDNGQRDLESVTTQPPVSEQKLGAFYALVIGIKDYQYLPQLLTPVDDATDIEKVLHDQYGFHTELLLNATRDQILEALDRYRRKLHEDDSLLIYYAGHGSFDEEVGQAYWVPIDAGNTHARWIIATEITGTAMAIPARHVLIIADSCYSGMITTRDVPPPIITSSENDAYLQKMRGRKSRHVMASGGKEPVQDRDFSGHPLNHSVFANAVLEGLKELPDEFSAEQLFALVLPLVGGRSKQLPEYSPIRDSLHDGGDFVFSRRVQRPVSPSPIPPPPPPPPPRSPEETAIRYTLSRYEEAYASMDIRELKKVWPSLSRAQEKAIRAGFQGARAVKVELMNRRATTVDGKDAKVLCDQRMTYTLVGKRQPSRVDPVEISLGKSPDQGWLVTDIKPQGRQGPRSPGSTD
jgi:caspase domain-containing protein